MSQQTLSGATLDSERERPSTMLFCPRCDGWILRSRKYDHEHTLYDSPADCYGDDETDTVDLDTEIDIEPNEQVGAVYDIELSYSVDFRFQIVAGTENQAKEIAEQLVEYPSNCADAYQVHDRISANRTIYADDDAIPSDWDPYGSTPLNDVYGETNDD